MPAPWRSTITRLSERRGRSTRGARTGSLAEGRRRPDGPGLGIELDEDARAGKLGHDWRNRESYDADDGSVVDG
jgi:hypothetical protein